MSGSLAEMGIGVRMCLLYPGLDGRLAGSPNLA